jgi:hypothetical protein
MVKTRWNEQLYEHCVKEFSEIKRSLDKYEHHVSTIAIEKRILQLIRQHKELAPALKNSLKSIAKLFIK